MTIYSSNKVLKAWATFKYVSMNSVINNPKISKEKKTEIFIKKEALYVEQLILAIREELRYKNKDIKQMIS